MTLITSNHLKLINLLSSTQSKDLEFLSCFFEITHITSYIKDIYKIIEPHKKTSLIFMIQKILNHNNIFYELKKSQKYLKEERIFFLILELLTKKTLNLNSIINRFSVTRRTLNYDIIEIKIKFQKFNLIVDSRIGTGIFLLGENIDIKNASFYYFSKFFIETLFLPQDFTKYFEDYFNTRNQFLDNDINYLISSLNFNNVFHFKKIIKSFYLAFECTNSKNSIGYYLKNPMLFKFYFSEIFSNKELNIFNTYILNSSFKNIDSIGLFKFLEILKICKGECKITIPNFENHLLFWNNLIQNHFPKTIISSKDLKNCIEKTFLKNEQTLLYSYEFSFLNLNMEQESITKCNNFFKDLKKYYKNIHFIDAIYLFFLLNSFEENTKEVFILYENFPKHIIKNLKKKIELKYNIKIIDFINIIHLKKYQNNIKTVGVFSNIDLSNYNFEVLYLKL